MNKLLIEHELIQELIAVIPTTTKKIYATVYYARIHKTRKNDDTAKIIKLLGDVKNKGVDVRLLINYYAPKNKINTSIKYFHHLATTRGIEVKITPAGRLTHAKTWTIDDDIVIIGSHNLTLRALRSSREISVRITDKYINEQMTKYFLKEWYDSIDKIL